MEVRKEDPILDVIAGRENKELSTRTALVDLPFKPRVWATPANRFYPRFAEEEDNPGPNFPRFHP